MKLENQKPYLVFLPGGKTRIHYTTSESASITYYLSKGIVPLAVELDLTRMVA